jgi:hypothetical protein
MLEYMLLRPIERPLLSETRSWLAADPRNQLLLVLDEAHMYRGVGGAEVGLLTHPPAEPSPLIASFPLSDENVDEWLDAAESPGDDESAGRAAG